MLAESPHPADVADPTPSTPGRPGPTESREAADHQAMTPPDDPRFDQGIQPDEQEAQVLERAHRQVAEPRDRAAEPPRLEGVAGEAQAGQAEQAAPGDPRIAGQGPDKAHQRQVRERLDQE